METFSSVYGESASLRLQNCKCALWFLVNLVSRESLARLTPVPQSASKNVPATFTLRQLSLRITSKARECPKTSCLNVNECVKITQNLVRKETASLVQKQL